MLVIIEYFNDGQYNKIDFSYVKTAIKRFTCHIEFVGAELSLTPEHSYSIESVKRNEESGINAWNLMFEIKHLIDEGKTAGIKKSMKIFSKSKFFENVREKQKFDMLVKEINSSFSFLGKIKKCLFLKKLVSYIPTNRNM
jgi:hypothetical protein